MKLARLSIKHPTFITAIVFVMLVAGYLMMSRMSISMFPDVNMPFVTVTTIYPGAGPKEMESQVSKVLEEQICAIAGLKHIHSVNLDSYSMVWSVFNLETDAQYAEQQVKNKIALVRNRLPRDIEEPIVKRHDPMESSVMTITLSAELSPAQLYDVAETIVKPNLEQVPNVGSVEIVGGTKREIQVNIDRSKLKEYETSLSLIAMRLGMSSQNIPVGKISGLTKELSFRTIGEFNSIDRIKNVVVGFYASDVPVTLGKFAEIKDTVQAVKTKGLLNGKSAVVIDVYKQSGANTVRVSDELWKKIKKINETLKSTPASPSLFVVIDGATPVRNNLDNVRETIFEGILLAFIVVYLFLGNFRSTFITITALPNSLLGAFIFMALSGFNINICSLLALSLSVGLLVDDAIVVRENIFRHIENGAAPAKAAETGTAEVALAVIATTLTVIAVFLPVGFLQGIVGQFLKQFGLTVVFAMAISLFDALTVAPMLSAYLIGNIKSEIKKKPNIFLSALYAPAKWFDKLQNWLEKVYEQVMHFALQHRLVILISAVILLGASLFLVPKIKTGFLPPNEFGEFTIDMIAPPGTTLDNMEQNVRLVDEFLRKEPDVATVLATVGNSNGESNIGYCYIKMVPEKNRKSWPKTGKRSTADMRDYIREKLQQFSDKMSIAVNEIPIAGDPYPFYMILKGDDIDALTQTVPQVLEKIKTIPGLVDVNTDFRPGKPEYQFILEPQKMQRLGVQAVTAGMELRMMVEGAVPAKFRENGREYDIRLKLRDDQRDLSKQFDYLYVPNMNYQLVKLKNIATPVLTTGPSKIGRRDRARYVSIYGNIDRQGAIGNAMKGTRKIMSEFKLPPGMTYEFSGETEEMEDMFKNMTTAAILSVVFIYFILASLYESLVIPFTIMTALPLAIVGALIALFVSHQSINLLTMIGLIMLLGLVTKNSILLVDYTQKLMQSGLNRNDALIKAGLTRLRPIMMTTFALIAGMLPVALAVTEVGQMRKGMGIAIIGGLLSSTILTLVVVPALFGYMDSFRNWSRKLFGRPQK